LPYFATYVASKAFDLVLAESLAEERRGEPVDVLALCPGATRTELGGARVSRSIIFRGPRIRAWSPRRRCARSAGAPCWSAVDCAALPTRPSPCHAQPRPAVSASRSACSAHGSPEAAPRPRQEATTCRAMPGASLPASRQEEAQPCPVSGQLRHEGNIRSMSAREAPGAEGSDWHCQPFETACLWSPTGAPIRSAWPAPV
jgi:hypothetical protein